MCIYRVRIYTHTPYITVYPVGASETLALKWGQMFDRRISINYF